jgi:hypothetical protein
MKTLIKFLGPEGPIPGLRRFLICRRVHGASWLRCLVSGDMRWDCRKAA